MALSQVTIYPFLTLLRGKKLWLMCNLSNVARELDRLGRDRREAASRTLRYSLFAEPEEDDGQAGFLGPSGAWAVSIPSLWLAALSLDRCGGGPHLSNVLC